MATTQVKQKQQASFFDLEAGVQVLSDKVDPEIREELMQLFRAIKKAQAPLVAATAMNRLCLRLIRHVYDDLQLSAKSDNVFKLVDDLCSSDGKGTRRLPRLVEGKFHQIRTISNYAGHALDHGSELPLGTDLVRDALRAYLWLLDWYYTDFESGPLLKSIYNERAVYKARKALRREATSFPILLTLIALFAYVLVSGPMVANFAEAPASGPKPSPSPPAFDARAALSRIEKIQLAMPKASRRTRQGFQREIEGLTKKAETAKRFGYANYFQAHFYLNDVFYMDRKDPLPRLQQAASKLETAYRVSEPEPDFRPDVVKIARTVKKWLSDLRKESPPAEIAAVEELLNSVLTSR